jgi:flagellar hook-length control protein FliK
MRELLATVREEAGATPAAAAATPPAATASPIAAGVQIQGAGAAAHEAPASARAAVAPVGAPTAAAQPAGDPPSQADASDGGGQQPGDSTMPAWPPTAARTAAPIDLRFEPVAPAAGPAPAQPAALTVPAATMAFRADEALRAVELPASTRLEHALATLDPDTRNLQAVVRSVRLFTAGDGLGEARLQLEPDHLGPVDLRVRVEHGSVSAHFRAETPAAQRWIEIHQQELRAGLREQGLEVKDLVVTTDPDGRRDRRQDAAPSRPARGRRGAAAEVDADAPLFEVRV